MSLRFKLDENLPGDAANLFGSAGHEVESALAEGLGRLPDASILEVCQRERRILITFDLDFADTRAYPPPTHPRHLGAAACEAKQSRHIAAARESAEAGIRRVSATSVLDH